MCITSQIKDVATIIISLFGYLPLKKSSLETYWLLWIKIISRFRIFGQQTEILFHICICLYCIIQFCHHIFTTYMNFPYTRY
uniref:Uncharacterized protein n=1 Tax=Aegilops tauschii subsp. strangulata TaxID=200361 RepID=A0A453S7T7_AEGTS